MACEVCKRPHMHHLVPVRCNYVFHVRWAIFIFPQHKERQVLIDNYFKIIVSKNTRHTRHICCQLFNLQFTCWFNQFSNFLCLVDWVVHDFDILFCVLAFPMFPWIFKPVQKFYQIFAMYLNLRKLLWNDSHCHIIMFIVFMLHIP